MPGPPVDKRRTPTVESVKSETREQLPVSRDRQRGSQPSRVEHRGVVQQAHALQRAAGNQAVSRMLDESEAPLEATAAPTQRTEDAHEQAAGHIGDLVAHAPAAAPLRALSAQRDNSRSLGRRAPDGTTSSRPLALPRRTSAPADAPASVKQALRVPGQPLDAATRRALPRELGVDLGEIRIHVDGDASRSADAIGAEAYTVGRDIVFGEGRFAPYTAAGRGLLAHEVAHAGQQAAGAMTGRVQKQHKDEKVPAVPMTKPFKVDIKGIGNSAAAVGEAFARQYYGASKSEVDASFGAFTISRDANEKEVSQGWAIVQVPAGMLKKYQALDADEKKKIDAEVDRRFAKRTGQDPAKVLGNTPADRTLAAQKEHMRDEVVGQRELIANLPDDIKSVLFAGGPNDKATSPEDYNQLVRIAVKLVNLTPEQRKDYLSRVNAETTSLDGMEASVDRYVAFQKEREVVAKKNDEAAKPLLGAEDVYKLYKQYKSLTFAVSLGKATKGLSGDKPSAEENMDTLNEQLAETEAALLAALEKIDIHSIAEFATAIEAYRLAFRTQAVNLALDLLARFEHMLFEERKKFSAAGAGTAVSQGIAATDASKFYAEARAEDQKGAAAQRSIDPMEKGPNKARDQAEVKQHQDAANAAREKGGAEVKRGTGNDPLVAARGTDREKLAGLDPAAAQAYLLETIDERAVEAHDARQEFIDDPERVFSLKDLVEDSFKLLKIENTVYGEIIRDHIAKKELIHLLTEGAKAAVVLALAILVPVGGWVAAAALVASAGISAYQAKEALDEYQKGKADFNLGFIQEEPSLIWVGIAMVAAAVDIGAAAGFAIKASKVIAESAEGLKSLEQPMRAFAKGEESAESLLAKIQKAEGLKPEVKAALERELKASEAAKDAWKVVAGKSHPFAVGSSDPGATTEAFRALLYSVQHGSTTIPQLAKDAKLADMLGDISRMTGAERRELEAAFEEVKELANSGKAKSMDEASLADYVDRWALNRGKPGAKEKLLDEMKAWKPLTAQQKQTLAALKKQKVEVTALYREQEALLAEREGLAAQQRNPATKTKENTARLQEILKRLGELDPSFKQSTIKKMVRVMENGHPVEKLVDVPINHPPGEIKRAEALLAKAEHDAQQAQITLYDRLRAAAPSDKAKETALKNVKADQAGGLKTPPTPLHADHIVSVREISEMEGFADLPWKDQKELVDMQKNLIPMDGAANASKGDRSWSTWPQASNYYPPETIAAMVKRENEVREAIQAAIKERLPKPAGGVRIAEAPPTGPRIAEAPPTGPRIAEAPPTGPRIAEHPSEPEGVPIDEGDVVEPAAEPLKKRLSNP